jgi:hypothetical protein
MAVDNPILELALDPQAKVPIGVGWSRWLPAGVTIDSATWSLDGLVNETQSINASETTDEAGVTHPAGTLAIVWISGIQAGQSYDCTVHIVASDGREDDRTIRVVGKER